MERGERGERGDNHKREQIKVVIGAWNRPAEPAICYGANAISNNMFTVSV